ncbi:19505_t:CDS:2, partial [Gigaspora rosea]
NSGRTLAELWLKMVEWTDAHIRTLIEERRNRNIEYHNLGRNRNVFWHSIANRINREHNTNFTGSHCKEKFSNLVRSYNLAINHPIRQCVNICQVVVKHVEIEWLRNTLMSFVRISGRGLKMNSIESVLLTPQTAGGIRSPSIISRRSQRHSPYPTSTHDNTNINNPGMRNSEQNISVPLPIETLSPQPPPYSRDEDAIASGATDEAQNNNRSQDSSNYEVAVPGSNLTPDLLNLSLSRNESDAIMHDIVSQPLFHTESINEEER